jgi:hypothetical protein
VLKELQNSADPRMVLATRKTLESVLKSGLKDTVREKLSKNAVVMLNACTIELKFATILFLSAITIERSAMTIINAPPMCAIQTLDVFTFQKHVTMATCAPKMFVILKSDALTLSLIATMAYPAPSIFVTLKMENVKTNLITLNAQLLINALLATALRKDANFIRMILAKIHLPPLLAIPAKLLLAKPQLVKSKTISPSNAL